MFDPIVQFFTRIFQAIGRAIGFVVSLVLRPFVWLGRWYRERGWMLRAVVGAILLCIVAGFAYFFWNTQRWTNFNPDYHASLDLSPLGGTAGQPAAPAGGIVTNGSESGLFMPLHLATMGFYVLRVRSNLVEIRLVLDR